MKEHVKSLPLRGHTLKNKKYDGSGGGKGWQSFKSKASKIGKTIKKGSSAVARGVKKTVLAPVYATKYTIKGITTVSSKVARKYNTIKTRVKTSVNRFARKANPMTYIKLIRNKSKYDNVSKIVDDINGKIARNKGKRSEYSTELTKLQNTDISKMTESQKKLHNKQIRKLTGKISNLSYENKIHGTELRKYQKKRGKYSRKLTEVYDKRKGITKEFKAYVASQVTVKMKDLQKDVTKTRDALTENINNAKTHESDLISNKQVANRNLSTAQSELLKAEIEYKTYDTNATKDIIQLSAIKLKRDLLAQNVQNLTNNVATIDNDINTTRSQIKSKTQEHKEAAAKLFNDKFPEIVGNTMGPLLSNYSTLNKVLKSPNGNIDYPPEFKAKMEKHFTDMVENNIPPKFDTSKLMSDLAITAYNRQVATLGETKFTEGVTRARGKINATKPGNLGMTNPAYQSVPPRSANPLYEGYETNVPNPPSSTPPSKSNNNNIYRVNSTPRDPDSGYLQILSHEDPIYESADVNRQPTNFYGRIPPTKEKPNQSNSGKILQPEDLAYVNMSDANVPNKDNGRGKAAKGNESVYMDMSGNKPTP